MKGFGWTIFLLILSLVYLDAFVPPTVHSSPSSTRRHFGQQANLRPTRNHLRTKATTDLRRHKESQRNKLWTSPNGVNNSPPPPQADPSFAHADILWKLKPSRDTPFWRRLWLKIAANLIRLDCIFKRQEPPLVLCPKGGQAVLEAHVECKDGLLSRLMPWRRRKKIGRFGFTTMAGPSNPPIQETVHDLYDLDANRPYRVGAIIYMFVEEAFRKRDVGTLALQVISLIQSIQACDFTMLVVDDNGSGKLVEWYERKGYQKAPKLQAMMGSPNGIYGTSMMTPTNRILPDDCQIQWW